MFVCFWFLPRSTHLERGQVRVVTWHPAKSSRRYWSGRRYLLGQSAFFKRNLRTRLWGNLYFNKPLAHNLSWVRQSKAAGSPFLRCYHTHESNCARITFGWKEAGFGTPPAVPALLLFVSLTLLCSSLSCLLGISLTYQRGGVIFFSLRLKENQSQKQINSKSNKIRDCESWKGMYGNIWAIRLRILELKGILTYNQFSIYRCGNWDSEGWIDSPMAKLKLETRSHHLKLMNSPFPHFTHQEKEVWRGVMSLVQSQRIRH